MGGPFNSLDDCLGAFPQHNPSCFFYTLIEFRF